MSSSTVSRWIKEGLKLAGIDVAIFNGRSVRVASSSNASKSNLTLEYILARSSWSSGSTWQRFYNRQIMNEDDVYQKTEFDLT